MLDYLSFARAFRTPGWSTVGRSHGYLEPNLGYLSRRNTAIIGREGMTAMHIPLQQQEVHGQRQLARPPRHGQLRMGNVLKKGDVVLRKGAAAEVKFIGHLPLAPNRDDIYLGLEFGTPVGNSNGTYKGMRIFSASRDYAGFYKASECMYRGESAARYLPEELDRVVVKDREGKQVIHTATGRIEVQHFDDPESQFYDQYYQMERKLAEAELNASGRTRYFPLAPPPARTERPQSEPRYINYLLELKEDRERLRKRRADDQVLRGDIPDNRRSWRPMWSPEPMPNIPPTPRPQSRKSFAPMRMKSPEAKPNTPATLPKPQYGKSYAPMLMKSPEAKPSIPATPAKPQSRQSSAPTPMKTPEAKPNIPVTPPKPHSREYSAPMPVKSPEAKPNTPSTPPKPQFPAEPTNYLSPEAEKKKVKKYKNTSISYRHIGMLSDIPKGKSMRLTSLFRHPPLQGYQPGSEADSLMDFDQMLDDRNTVMEKMAAKYSPQRFDYDPKEQLVWQKHLNSTPKSKSNLNTKRKPKF